MTENEIVRIVEDASIRVHRILGPGLLDMVYELALAHELQRRGLELERQVPITVDDHGAVSSGSIKADIIVEKKVILELKSADNPLPGYKKRLLNCLQLSECKLGLLLNFGVCHMKHGIIRVVSGP